MPRWTTEARARQAEAIRRWKPWEHSTGPKTAKGKRRSASNSLAGPSRLGGTGLMRRILKMWRAGMNDSEAFDAVFDAIRARK